MSKIAALVTHYFEDVEYTQPAKAFTDAGHEIVNVGLTAGETVEGKKEHTPVKIDKAVSDVTASDFDALFIPGGFSPDQLRAHDAPVNFVSAFMDTGKPVFAICHGPQLLITANKLKGRTATGYKSIAQDIKNAGANFKDQEVVIDDKLVTSRNPNDIPAFIKQSLNMLS